MGHLKQVLIIFLIFRLAKVKRSNTDTVTDSAKHFKKDDVGLLACQKDTGAGFFRDEEYEEDFADEMYPVILEEMPPPVLGGDELTQCVDCKKEFTDSQLLKNFDILVCDNCRDSDKHKLCTKTEAKQNYLLKVRFVLVGAFLSMINGSFRGPWPQALCLYRQKGPEDNKNCKIA